MISADGRVGVGGDGADLGDFLAGGAGLGDLLQFVGDRDHGLVDAALQVHRVHAGGHVLHAFADDGLGQHGGGGGAVTGDVGGLGSDFLDHLRAHVLELVLQFDFLGDGHAVLGDGGGAEGALEHHVAALGAQGDLDRVGQNVHALDHAGTGRIMKSYVFCSHIQFLLFVQWDRGIRRALASRRIPESILIDGSVYFFSTTPMMSSSRMTSSSSPSTLTLAGVLAEQDAVADLDGERAHFAVVDHFAGPTASTSP